MVLLHYFKPNEGNHSNLLPSHVKSLAAKELVQINTVVKKTMEEVEKSGSGKQ